MTLKQVKLNGVSDGIAGFVVPLCATIHLSGSAMKITACAVALVIMQGGSIALGQFTGFILMLGVMMVAAPGVPGGAIMAALGAVYPGVHSRATGCHDCIVHHHGQFRHGMQCDR